MSYKLLLCALFLCGVMVIRNQKMYSRIKEFNNYLRKFNKSYSNEEFMIRMINFEESLKEIEKLNSKQHGTGAVHGLTKFSDWSKEEYNKLFVSDATCEEKIKNCSVNLKETDRQRQTQGRRVKLNRGRMNESNGIDWREHRGVIGPVENQKLCNGCWAFAIIGVMEAMSVINGIGQESLSVQLIDCVTECRGCQGGNIQRAMDFLCFHPHHYFVTSADIYPLELITETCKMVPKKGRQLKSYGNYCYVSDTFLKDLIRGNPVMAVINAVSLMNYNSGIIMQNCHNDSLGMFHVVLIVGYDSTTDEDGEEIEYFIIKNSWGDDWGEDGFARIATGEARNLCGIYDHIGTLDVV